MRLSRPLKNSLLFLILSAISGPSFATELPKCVDKVPMDCLMDMIVFMDEKLTEAEEQRRTQETNYLEIKQQLKNYKQASNQHIQQLENSLKQLASFQPVFKVTQQFSVERRNSQGNSDKGMIKVGHGFCYLTGVGIEETDSGDELSSCHVVNKNGQWTLRASLKKNADNDAYCQATCVTW